MGSRQERHVVDEVYGFIKVFNDGSVERPISPAGLSPSNPTHFVEGVATRDVTIDPTTNIWARIFLPKPPSPSSRIGRKKIPLVLHFHGGGFCSGSPHAKAFHTFCSRMASQSQSIWVSVDYRLAPEHRLPAAYDDAFTALMWIHAQSIIQRNSKSLHPAQLQDGHNDDDDDDDDVHEATTHGHDSNGGHGEHATLARLESDDDVHLLPGNAYPWLFRYADFQNLFLAGESSGGTIVHYLNMRILNLDLSPIQIRGRLIIHGAFLIKGVFNSISFYPNMERRPNTHRRLMLPEGEDLDHPLVDPFHPNAPTLRDIHLPPSLIVIAELDELCKSARYYANVLRQYGHEVDVHFTVGCHHCFHLKEPSHIESVRIFEHLAAFIQAHCVLTKCESKL